MKLEVEVRPTKRTPWSNKKKIGVFQVYHLGYSIEHATDHDGDHDDDDPSFVYVVGISSIGYHRRLRNRCEVEMNNLTICFFREAYNTNILLGV